MTQSPEQAVTNYVEGYRHTQILATACELGVFDRIQAAAVCAKDLSEELELDFDVTETFMETLRGMGMIEANEEGVFNLTEQGSLLTADTELHNRAKRNGAEVYLAWSALRHTLETGQAAYDNFFGQGVFDHHKSNPQSAERFNNGLSESARRRASQLATAYDFSAQASGRILDIGGGHGVISKTIKQAHPTAQIDIFDIAPSLDQAKNTLAAYSDVAYIAGDFFKAIPDGYDTLLLSEIIHDWDDARALKILQNCRQALAERGRLVIAERIVEPGGTASASAQTVDLQMYVTYGGKNRTVEQHKNLLSSSGLELVTKRVINQEISLLEVAAG